MALNVFIGKDKFPSDMKYAFNVDSYFVTVELVNDEFTNIVLNRLEQAEYVNGRVFKDRFGGGLYTQHLSTGSKVLLLTHYRPNLLVNGAELGINGWQFLTLLNNGNIYFRNTNVSFSYVYGLGQTGLDMNINGIQCKEIDDVREVLLWAKR